MISKRIILCVALIGMLGFSKLFQRGLSNPPSVSVFQTSRSLARALPAVREPDSSQATIAPVDSTPTQKWQGFCFQVLGTSMDQPFEGRAGVDALSQLQNPTEPIQDSIKTK